MPLSEVLVAPHLSHPQFLSKPRWSLSTSLYTGRTFRHWLLCYLMLGPLLHALCKLLLLIFIKVVWHWYYHFCFPHEKIKAQRHELTIFPVIKLVRNMIPNEVCHNPKLGSFQFTILPLPSGFLNHTNYSDFKATDHAIRSSVTSTTYLQKWFPLGSVFSCSSLVKIYCVYLYISRYTYMYLVYIMTSMKHVLTLLIEIK